MVIISANSAIRGAYDYTEVARSVLIAIAASYAALDLSGRVAAAAKGRIRLAWLSGGAIAMGIGIWEMHLKAMLAFRLPVPVEYHWPTMLAAFLVAILASAVALYVASRQKMGLVEALTGSMFMGAGIAGLHYLLMAAMRSPAAIRYSSILVVSSVLLAILFSLIALLLAFGLREETRWTVPRRLGSALVMGAAISAMHYTGMAAASFFPAPPPGLSHAVSISPLANNGIAIVTLIVLVAAMVTSSVERRAGVEVRRVNLDLERRVAERTLQLETVNQALRKEIAERERAEESVRKSEDRLRLVIDTIPQQIWSGPPDGSLDFCNAQWRSFVGLTLEELRGEGWQRMLHPDDRERVLRAWRESVATGTPYEQEERHRRADGQYRWFLARGVALKDAEGRIIRWYGTNTDIEDRKLAEDRLRLVIDTLPALVWSKLPEGSADFLNQRFREYTGLSVEEGLGWGWMNAFHPEDRAEKEWRSAFAAGQPFEKEARLRGVDGTYRWFLLRAVPLRDEQGKVVKWYGTSTDIEDRRSAEEALLETQQRLAQVTRIQAMGELAAAIAHEVNQPLTAIVTNANFSLRQLIGSSPNLDELRTAIKEIVNDGTRASAVVARIRGLLVKGASRRAELDINEIIQEVVSLLRNELTRNRIHLGVELAANLPRVQGDPVQLQQVLINLIMNAVEAMRLSTERPRKLVLRSAKNADEVLVQVQDSGPEIAPDLARRIFEPFFTTKAEGIGMGLAISRSIIESHGGHLSQVPASHGAVFQFTLPVAANDASSMR
jgi:PAS domain S-box-containing protein